MRFPTGLLVSLVAVGLVGCSSAAGPSAAGASAAGPSASPAPTGLTRTEPAAVHASRAEPETRAGARAAAVRFDRLYLASRFAASWAMLAPAMKRQIPRRVWIRAHNSCLPARAGMARAIKAVTIFGNTAIITETIAGARSRLDRTEHVFSYANGSWGYSPQDMSIYQHESAAADIAAAKSAGTCGSWKGF